MEKPRVQTVSDYQIRSLGHGGHILNMAPCPKRWMLSFRVMVIPDLSFRAFGEGLWRCVTEVSGRGLVGKGLTDAYRPASETESQRIQSLTSTPPTQGVSERNLVALNTARDSR